MTGGPISPPPVRGAVGCAAAGAVAALVWAVQEPLDQRIARYGYSDVAVLGKALTAGPRWRPLGLAIHACNGAAFGLVFHVVRRRVRRGDGTIAVALALVEHVGLFPLSTLVDRHHPRRGTPGIPRLMTPRAFAQATWRHLLFGLVLGRLARRA